VGLGILGRMLLRVRGFKNKKSLRNISVCCVWPQVTV